MSTFILIVMFQMGNGATSFTQEFDSLQSCEVARNAVQDSVKERWLYLAECFAK